MRPVFTDAQDEAMRAAAVLVESYGFRAAGRTVSKRMDGGRSVGGGALRYKRGQQQRCTVGPRTVFFCCVEKGLVMDQAWAPTNDLQAVQALLDRNVVKELPPPRAMSVLEERGQLREDDGEPGLRFARKPSARRAAKSVDEELYG